MFTAGMGNLTAIPVLILLFGISIFVHEFGHFLAARLCGLVVDVFSIGFGPAIWKRKYKGILFKIGCIPIGGYVALPQLDPSGMETIQKGAKGEAQAGQRNLPPIAAWKKIIVSLSGAAGNLLLAVGIAWLVYWIGMPAGPAERSTVVGFVDPQSKAYAQGLRIGDEVLSVNRNRIRKWSDFTMEAALHNEVAILARTPEGEEKALRLPTERGLLGEQSVAGVEGRSLCSVLSVASGMTAAKAGIQGGDTIVEFAGREVFSRAHLIERVNDSLGQTVPIKVTRNVNGKPVLVTLSVTPEYDASHKQVRIGVVFNTAAVDLDTVVRPRPGEQLRQHAGAIFRFLGALMTPKQARAASQAVGGPVAIIASYWFIVKTSLMLAIWFTGFLNVNLGIINLLPIPVLDGGHIVFSLWEMVTRRPVSARVANGLVNVFAALLIALFVLLSVRDVDRFTPARRLVREVFNGKAENAPTGAVQSADSPMRTNDSRTPDPVSP